MSKPIDLNLLVCGKFHILNYAALLESRISNFQQLHVACRKKYLLQHKLSGSWVKNHLLKEYLIQTHRKILKDKYYEKLTPIYHKIWQMGVKLSWKKARLVHLVSHGAGVSIIKKAKKQGSTVIVEVVNTHPTYRKQILSKERSKLNLPQKNSELYSRESLALKECELADFILAPTDIVRKSYEIFFPNKKIFVNPYAANLDRFLTHNEKTKERLINSNKSLEIVCIGQIGLRKGQLYLLEAIKNLKLYDRRVNLTLVGGIDLEIKRILSEYLYYFNHVERVDSAHMPAFLKTFDVFCLPSLEEGLAVSICEAMATGLVVIATKESGAEELDNESGTIQFVRAGSVDDLQQTIENLLGSNKQVEDLKIQSKSLAETEHNWERYTDRLVRIYEECANE